MRSLSLIALLIFLGGCSYFNDPGSEIILNVDNEFEIEISESLVPNGRELTFRVIALNDVECEDSVLSLNAERGGNLINLRIDDIITLSECGTERSFPTGEVSFDLRKIKYNLAIEVKDQLRHDGILDVSDKEYVINLDDTKGLVIDREVLKRIPENFAWGYYDANKPAETELVETFLRSNNLVYRPLTDLEEGFYSYFSIDTNNNIQIPTTQYTGKINRVAYSNIDIEDTKAKVATLKTDYPELKFTMHFSDGTVL